MTTTQHRPRVQPFVRMMILRDYDQVMAIERASFEYPWTRDDFINCNRQRQCLNYIAECDNQIVGYMVYELREDKSLHLLNIAVHSGCRRQGVGVALLDKLFRKLSKRRPVITVNVRETNLDAQLFFRAMGFKCVGTTRGLYEDSDEAAYLFEYRIQP